MSRRLDLWRKVPRDLGVLGPFLRSWAAELQAGFKIVGGFVCKECSPIFGQRMFRTFRVAHLHCRLWSGLRHHRPVRKTLLSFLLVALCDKQKTIGESITEKELVEHNHDLDFIHELTTATVVCPHCRDRLVVDKPVPNVKYCHCPKSPMAYDRKVKGYGWTPFVETADLLIWRMPHPDRPGLFMYKVYGFYDDLTPMDFLNTQLDIDYRRTWDDTVLDLKVVEKAEDINQDVIYWQMKWPTMFSNRDYVFARRHHIDEEKKVIVIISKAIPHPDVPDRSGIHRVKEYWSVMQVNAVNGLDKPGVEFGLTYFDNPGVSLPQWMTNWAAMTAIPEFLDKQRNAARRKAKKLLSDFASSVSCRIEKACPAGNQEKIRNQSHSQEEKDTPSQLQPTMPNIPTPTSSRNKATGDSSKTKLSEFFKDNVLQLNR